MNYRKGNPDDLNQLIVLRKKQLVDEGCLGDNNIDNELEEYFPSSLADKSLSLWVAYEEDKIIGTCGVCFLKYPPSYTNPTGKIAYITNVYTRDEYREQGIATKLLEYIMEEIKSNDYKIVRLHASIQGQKLYKKLGFSDAKGFMDIKI